MYAILFSGERMANELIMDLPKGARQVGTLWDHFELKDLDQDILQINLPNDYFLDVGYFPDMEPDGMFHIVVGKDVWQNQLYVTDVKTPLDVQRVLNEQIQIYGDK